MSDSSTADIQQFLSRIERAAIINADWPEEDTPLAKVTQQFFENNWLEAREQVLAKTTKLEVSPQGPGLHIFDFRAHVPYKRRLAEGTVELVPGPLEGTVYYRPDLLAPRDRLSSSVAVSIVDRQFFHPNFSRQHGQLCLGHLPAGPIPLVRLLEHVYSIVSYQNLSVTDPFDAEAAAWFSQGSQAFEGFPPVEPLY